MRARAGNKREIEDKRMFFKLKLEGKREKTGAKREETGEEDETEEEEEEEEEGAAEGEEEDGMEAAGAAAAAAGLVGSDMAGKRRKV